MLERLHKLLARAGVAALRPAEDMILAGRVTVNGRVVRELGARADPDSDVIAVDSQPIDIPDPAAPHRYILLHKPVGVISTAFDPEGRPTVVELVPDDVRVFPVGRLDADSEGLLLLTDDGDLAYRLTHPRFEVDKEYRVLLDRSLTLEAMRRWRNGIEIDNDYITAPAWVERLEHSPEGDWVRVVLQEGKKRQIREVARALGYDVRRLIRVREGPITLADLPTGAWRELTTNEVNMLRRHVQHVPSREADEAREERMAERDPKGRRLRVVRGSRRSNEDELAQGPASTERSADAPGNSGMESTPPARTRFDGGGDRPGAPEQNQGNDFARGARPARARFDEPNRERDNRPRADVRPGRPEPTRAEDTYRAPRDRGDDARRTFGDQSSTQRRGRPGDRADDRGFGPPNDRTGGDAEPRRFGSGPPDRSQAPRDERSGWGSRRDSDQTQPERGNERGSEAPRRDASRGFGPRRTDNRGFGGPRRDDSRGFGGPRRDDSRGPSGPRRDDNRGFGGPRRDDSRGFGGPRRDDSRGFGGPRRDDNRGFGGPRRDDSRGFGGPRRDDSRGSSGPRRDDSRGFGGPRRDDNPGSSGPRRDNNRGFGGPRRDDNPGFGGPRRDDNPGFGGPRRDDNRGFGGPRPRQGDSGEPEAGNDRRAGGFGQSSGGPPGRGSFGGGRSPRGRDDERSGTSAGAAGGRDDRTAPRFGGPSRGRSGPSRPTAGGTGRPGGPKRFGPPKKRR